MRTRLSIQGKTNVWDAEVHPTLEHALFRWLSIPVNKRTGGFVSDAAKPEPRLPSYAEVSIGLLLVEPSVYARHKHRFTVGYSDHAKHGKIDGEYPRVHKVTLPWITLVERDYQIMGRERGLWISKLDALLKRAEEETDGTRLSWSTPAEAVDAPGAKGDAVVEAEWVEVTESEKTAREEATFVIRLPLADFRRALGVCTDMGRQSGRVYRAYCEDAREAVEAFVSRPSGPTARHLGRAASALADAIPDHFPGMDAAGVWAMISRPALRGMAEAAHAWAYVPSAGVVAEGDAERAPRPDADATQPEVAAETVAAEGAVVAEPAVAAPAPRPEEPAKVARPPRRRGRTRSDADAVEAASGATASAPEAPVSPIAEVVPEPDPKPESGRPPAGWQPTHFDQKVIKAMKGKRPMRRIEIAAQMSCGRGAVNRTIERLIKAGYVVEAFAQHVVLSEGRR